MSIIDTIREDFGKHLVWNEKLISAHFWPDAPVYAGKPINTRSAIRSLVKMLNLRSFLELGSFHYETSDQVADAMQESGPDFVVNSYDIKVGGYDGGKIRPEHPKVRAMFLFPQHTSYDDWKYRDPGVVYPEFKNMTNEEIFKKNCELLKIDAPAGGYDIIYMDSDHSYEGVKHDWEYSKGVSHENTLIVWDDLYAHVFPGIRRLFDEVQVPKWDFKEWNDANPDRVMNIGVSLIR